jgi:hypothetical protein
MKGFIEVTNSGTSAKTIINVDKIVRIERYEKKEESDTFIFFSNIDCRILAKESYEIVKSLIEAAK